MFTRTRGDFFLTMTASLALLGVLRALKIDTSLAVIKNDCYERLAIGQRHNPKDIYKTSHVTTVFECQLLCTEEKEACKSFSFGIGVKGNASCELSTDMVKESADLKPIGTKADTDYDLYIKKLGCTLVIDKNNPAFDHYKPQNKPTNEEFNQASSNSYEKPQSGTSYKPVTVHEKPSSSYTSPSKPPDGYISAATLKPMFLPHDQVQQVQTLVSVSSGPQKPLIDTYHEILVGDGTDNYARPPFRPSALNNPYDKQKPKPGGYSSRPQKPDYDRPDFDRPGSSDYGLRPQRPEYGRPNPDRYDYRPPRPDYDRPNPDRYDSRPGESNVVSYGHRPIPDKYGSYIPRPDHYGEYFKPRPDENYRPGDYYRPRPPSDGYGQRPVRPDDDYHNRPSNYDRPDNYRPQRPDRPSDYDRPKPLIDYDSRPPTGGYDRPDPQRPQPARPLDYDRPKGDYDSRPPTGGYDRPDPQRPQPARPLDYERPKGDYGSRPPSGYERPQRPLDYDRPKPPSDYGGRPTSGGYDSDLQRPLRPERPLDYERPNPSGNAYRPKPPSGGYGNDHRPDRPLDHDRPNPSGGDYGAKPPNSGYDNDFHRPHRPDRPLDYDRPNLSGSDYGSKPPGGGYDRPNSSGGDYNRPSPPDNNYDRPNPPKGDNYHKPSGPEGDYKPQTKPSGSNYRPRPTNEYLFHGDIDRYDQQPEKPTKPSSGYQKPEAVKSESNKPSSGYDNTITGASKPKDPHAKPSIVTQSVGIHGESITSIITELEEACFRRVLAGKRVTRALVKRAVFCERVEECQRECADEKRFACEGFNYRLDPSGRGKGECELLDIPLSHLDIGRDLYPDHDYDYYERDRNAASADCRGHGYNQHYDYDSYSNRRHDQRPYDGWNEDRRYGNRRPRPDYGYDARPPYGYDSRPPNGYDSRPPNGYNPRPAYGYDDGYRPNGNRRGDFAYHDSHHSEHAHDYHYEHYDHGRPPYDYQSYEPYLPPNRRPYNEDRYHNKYHIDRERDKSYWGFTKPSWGSYGGSYGTTSHNHQDFERKNYYLPPPIEGNKNWGQYGGNYGNGAVNLQYNGYGHSQSFDFWGLNKFEEKFHNYGELPPKRPPNGGDYIPERPYRPPSGSGNGNYLPERPYRPPSGPGGYAPELPPPSSGGNGNYLPERPYRPPSGAGGYVPELPPKSPVGDNYLPENSLKPPFSNGGGGGYKPERPHRPPGRPSQDNDPYNNAILPAEPRYPYRYDFLKDECSLRTASGFRLSKGRVKKFMSVPSIYECELLCFKEKDFPCLSYAYRYSSSLNGPRENCYLSHRSYKELDFYTDLEPDRNFDVYTMNNMQKCEQLVIPGKDDSECFWRVRSAQRLDHKVVLDSLSVKSIVECQIECLKSRRFTCRAFSFRYGSPVIGGPVDNCLLTDWPYYEMDPRVHFIPEPGFEIYERGSFGHGCEPHHFGIKGKPWKNPGTRIDQLCYVGFGSPAKLLPQATRKELQVATEEECKAECSKLRETTLFQCMSLSYNTNGPKWEANCKLSDILQRDLLPKVDFVHDPDAWLFAWDNYNPECKAVANEPVHNHIGPSQDRYDNDIYNNALGTWRVYSVSGWPCRRGTLCRENTVAGFWYCELEGGDASTWDYCCRPDHQCGYSEGFQYQWCYVGPIRTQWRKCSDRYYPYVHNIIDRFDRPPGTGGGGNYLPDQRPPHHSSNQRPPPFFPDQRPHDLPNQRPHDLPNQRPPPQRPGIRPDRPPAPPTRPPPRPSLGEYEMEFNSQFLDPPKPGGFGQPRHWPLSYLHKEMPPNSTDSESRLMKVSKGADSNPKFAAIQNLIDVIKSNDLKNVQYQITNESNKADDILFVKIPLPTNFTEETKKSEKMVKNEKELSLDPIDLRTESKNTTKRSQKALSNDGFVPIYRRSFITRTNATNHRARNSRTL